MSRSKGARLAQPYFCSKSRAGRQIYILNVKFKYLNTVKKNPKSNPEPYKVRGCPEPKVVLGKIYYPVLKKFRAMEKFETMTNPEPRRVQGCPVPFSGTGQNSNVQNTLPPP